MTHHVDLAVNHKLYLSIISQHYISALYLSIISQHYISAMVPQGKLQSAPTPPVGLQHLCQPTVKLHILPLVWIFLGGGGVVWGAGSSSWDLPCAERWIWDVLRNPNIVMFWGTLIYLCVFLRPRQVQWGIALIYIALISYTLYRSGQNKTAKLNEGQIACWQGINFLHLSF